MKSTIISSQISKSCSSYFIEYERDNIICRSRFVVYNSELVGTYFRGHNIEALLYLTDINIDKQINKFFNLLLLK